jgi:hypothetical protein
VRPQNPRRLEQGWKSFARAALPATASDVQRECMRDSFYAGALVAFSTLTAEVSPGDEVSAEDMFLMVDLDAELDAFRKELDARCAQPRGRQS